MFRKKTKGFTLIELLVVIAIIAILVVIVIVAIDPVKRLNDARDRAAASDVRSTGTLISTCVTKHLEGTPAGWEAACSTAAAAEIVAVGNPASGLTWQTGLAAGDNNVCVYKEGATGHFYQYRHTTGQVAQFAVAPSCP